MYKQVVEKVRGTTRTRKTFKMFCDSCGRQINWCVNHEHKHYCEKCFTQAQFNTKIKG